MSRHHRQPERSIDDPPELRFESPVMDEREEREFDRWREMKDEKMNNCAYCIQDTAGNHAHDCPMNCQQSIGTEGGTVPWQDYSSMRDRMKKAEAEVARLRSALSEANERIERWNKAMKTILLAFVPFDVLKGIIAELESGA